MNDDLTDNEKHIISFIIACPGVVLISVSLKPDILPSIVGIIGIALLAFGAICEGSIRK